MTFQVSAKMFRISNLSEETKEGSAVLNIDILHWERSSRAIGYEWVLHAVDEKKRL